VKKLSLQACLLAVLMPGGGGARAQGPVRAVVLVYRVTNSGPVEAGLVAARCVLPVSNRYQEIIDLHIDPEASEEKLDEEDQRVISVPLGKIPPGETRAVRVLARVRLKEVTVPLTAKNLDVEPLSAQRKQAYLRDEPLLKLDDVRAIAQEAIGDKTRDLEKARALYDYMTGHCRYNIDNVVDAADVVLAGKPASCSELAYTYVALCRSVGIPARPVSAFVNREGTSPSVDWRTHRWAEFFAEEVGWVPVDPTNRLNNPSEDFFGRQEGKYLAVVDDGVVPAGGPGLGWCAFTAYAERIAVQLRLRRSAAWRTSTNRPKETEFFTQACEALRGADAVARRQAVEQWHRERSPLRVAFFLEALFDADAEVRKTAADAIGRSNDASVILALMKQVETEPDADVRTALLDAARQLFNTSDDERKAKCVCELAKSRTDEALELLDGIWDDEARAVRKAAAQMLYKFGDKPAVHETYRQLVRDEDEFIRILAALRWARVGSHEALERLIEHLGSTNSWDREKALAELEKRTQDSFGFNTRLGPTTRTNRDAIQKFRDWLDEHPQAK